MVLILSPLAMATNRLGEGIGQGLLRHALAELHKDSVGVAVTYGDPAVYVKVGLMPVSETTAPAPQPLSHPDGWVGQLMPGAELVPPKDSCTCVLALNDPAFR